MEELASKAQKHLVDMRDSLLEETESKYTTLCEEVLEVEEEGQRVGAGNGGSETRELLFPVFGREFLDELLSKTLIVAWTAIDSAGANGLI